MVSQDR